MFKLDKFFLGMLAANGLATAVETGLQQRKKLQETQRQQLLGAKASTESILKQALEMKAQLLKEMAERGETLPEE